MYVSSSCDINSPALSIIHAPPITIAFSSIWLIISINSSIAQFSLLALFKSVLLVIRFLFLNIFSLSYERVSKSRSFSSISNLIFKFFIFHFSFLLISFVVVRRAPCWIKALFERLALLGCKCCGAVLWAVFSPSRQLCRVLFLSLRQAWSSRCSLSGSANLAILQKPAKTLCPAVFLEESCILCRQGLLCLCILRQARKQRKCPGLFSHFQKESPLNLSYSARTFSVGWTVLDHRRE